MNTIRLFLVSLGMGLLLAISGCTNLHDVNDKEHSVENDSKVRQLVESGEYIDLDIKTLALSNCVNKGVTRSLQDDADKASAALYRFYSHVTVVDDLYVCDLKSGKEINVSDRVFNELRNSLEEMNRHIGEAKAKGEPIYVGVPDSAYLESLLK